MIYKSGAEPLAVFVSVLLYFINTHLQVKPTTDIKKERFTPVVEIGLRKAKPWRLVSLIIKSSSNFQHTSSNF